MDPSLRYLPYIHAGEKAEEPSRPMWVSNKFPDWESMKKQHKDLKGSLEMNWPADGERKPVSGWYLYNSTYNNDYFITWLSPYPTERFQSDSKRRYWPPFTGGVASYSIDINSGKILKIEYNSEWGHEDDMKYTLLQETDGDLIISPDMIVTNDGVRKLMNPYLAAGKKNINIFQDVMNWTDFPDELV